MNKKTVLILCIVFSLACLIHMRFTFKRVLSFDDYPVHNIYTGLNYDTIQGAIDANETLDGHEILVEAGTFYENLEIYKSIILLGENRKNTIIDGNHSITAITITADNVTVRGFTIQYAGNLWPDAWAGGVLVYKSKGCNISYNRIIHNFYFGIYLLDSNNNYIGENEIYRNFDRGIFLENSNNDTILENDITYNRDGFYMSHSDGNIISRNHILDNYYVGIKLVYCRDNMICLNDFINNRHQVSYYEGPLLQNRWDNNLEGNYWGRYDGTDLNHDGIGETPNTVAVNNTDRFPLMGMFSSFETSLGYNVNVISNSTIEDFEYFESSCTIKVNASNKTSDQTYGFCRVSIPKDLISPPYDIIINNGTAEPLFFNDTVYDNSTHRGIYFAYEHSTLEIVIIPESPSLIILSLFMIATLLAVTVYRKRANTMVESSLVV